MESSFAEMSLKFPKHVVTVKDGFPLKSVQKILNKYRFKFNFKNNFKNNNFVTAKG